MMNWKTFAPIATLVTLAASVSAANTWEYAQTDLSPAIISFIGGLFSGLNANAVLLGSIIGLTIALGMLLGIVVGVLTALVHIRAKGKELSKTG